MKQIYLSLCLLFNILAFSQASLSTSLTACYALDANANDPISSLTGTLSAVTPTVNRFSQPNTAMAFNGTTTSFIQLPNNSLLKSNAVSFSGWAKTNSLNTPYQYIVFTTNGCFSYYEGYEMAFQNVSTNAYRLQVAKSNSSCSPSGQIVLMSNTTTLTANSWIHVGFYAGPDSLKIYVNGVLDGAMANSNPLTYAATTNVYLGGTNQSTNQPLNGALDNVRFYNRKLSNAEFNQLYTLDPICQPQPVASFSMSANNVCVNQPVSLISTSTNSPSTFSWQMAGGTPSVSAVANPTVSYVNAGTYTISLVASNAFGSSAPVSQIINVATCIGVNELINDKSVYVFPNPTKNEINIIGADKGSQIKIFNALGALIFAGVAEAESEKINLSQYNQGLYFIRLVQNGKHITTKLIKE